MCCGVCVSQISVTRTTISNLLLFKNIEEMFQCEDPAITEERLQCKCFSEEVSVGHQGKDGDDFLLVKILNSGKATLMLRK